MTAYGRRALLALTAAAVTAGCAGSGPFGGPDRDGDGIPDKRDDYPDDASRAARFETVSTTVAVRDRHRWVIPVPMGDSAVEFVVRVLDGPPVSVRAFGPTEAGAYQRGEPATPAFERVGVREAAGTLTAAAIADQGVRYHFFVAAAAGASRPSRVRFVAEIFR